MKTIPSPLETRYHINLANLNEQQLRHSAWTALHVQGKRNDEIISLCIEANSGPWDNMIRELLPDFIQKSCREEESQIVSGTAPWSVVEYLARTIPRFADKLLQKPPSGKVKLLIMSGSSFTVGLLEPKPETGLN